MYQTSAENNKKVHICMILPYKIKRITSVSFYRKLPPHHAASNVNAIFGSSVCTQ